MRISAVLASCWLCAVAVAQAPPDEYRYQALVAADGFESRAGVLPMTSAWDEGSGVFVIGDALEGFGALDARASAGGDVLFGLAEGEAASDFALVVALRLGEVAPQPLEGDYQAVTAKVGAGGRLAFSSEAFAAAEADYDGGVGTVALTAGVFQVMGSNDGAWLIGAPADGPGLLLASRRGADAPAGSLWLLELAADAHGPSGAVGALTPFGTRARIHERWAGPRGLFDFRGESALSVAGGDGTLDQTPVATLAGGGLLGALAGSGLVAAIPAPPPAAGDVSAASLSPLGAPAAPGELRSLFGVELAAGVEEAESIPLPTTLAGGSIDSNGALAPLLFASPGQVNYQLPENVSGPLARLTARNGGETAVSVLTRVAPTAPAVFTYDGSGGGAGIFTHADFSLIAEDSPAERGEIIIAFLTGLGAARQLPRVLVNGVAAEVFYAGRTPGFVGLDQINLRVPGDVPDNPAAPFTLATRDGWSDTTTIAVGR